VVRRRQGDVLLVATGLLFGAVSLTYPFCRDQAVYAYVGRAWFQEGRIPYRDALDQKTPLIFFVHGVLASLFGNHEVLALHAAEMLLVVAAGILAVLGSTRPREPVADGVIGLTVVAVSLLYYTGIPFLDMGSCEIWGVVALLGARAVVARATGRHRALTAGVLAGVAVLAKPPLGILALLIVAEAVRRSTGARDRARTAALVVGGMAAPLLVTAFYFWAVGALGDAYDLVVRCNLFYRGAESRARDPVDAVWTTMQGTRMFGPALLFAIGPSAAIAAVAARIKRWDVAWRYGEPLLAMVLGLLIVCLQLRFFFYHFVPMLVGAALAIARLAQDGVALTRRLRALGSAATCAALGLLVVGTQLIGGGDAVVEWTRRAGNAMAYVSGRISKEALDDTFDMPGFFDERHAREVASWLTRNSSEDDAVLVRGYEPEIYGLSSRRYGGRFFWSEWLTSPGRAYRRAEWLAEDERDFERIAPTWVVALPPTPQPWSWDWFRARGDIESADWYEARGYVRRAAFGPFTILHRDVAAAAALTTSADGLRR
jgi:hypothetical protein